MNDMALAEYLLQKYADSAEKVEAAKMKKDNFEYAYYLGKADLVHTVLRERLGLKIYDTDDEWIARNGICSVKVRKGGVDDNK